MEKKKRKMRKKRENQVNSVSGLFFLIPLLHPNPLWAFLKSNGSHPVVPEVMGEKMPTRSVLLGSESGTAWDTFPSYAHPCLSRFS